MPEEELIQTAVGERAPSDIIHTPSGDITHGEMAKLKEEAEGKAVTAKAVKKTIRERKEPLPSKVEPTKPALELVSRIPHRPFGELEAYTPPPEVEGSTDWQDYVPKSMKSYTSGAGATQILATLRSTKAPVLVQQKFIKRFGLQDSKSPVARELVGRVSQDIKDYSKLEGEAQFDRGKVLGFVPKDAEFLPPEVEGGQWSYVTQTDLSEYLGKLVKADVMEQSIADTTLRLPPGKRLAFIQSHIGDVIRVREQWEAEWEAELKAFETELKGYPQELQDAYKERGIEGYSKAVVTYNAKVAKERVAREANLALLKPYEAPALYPAAYYPEYYIEEALTSEDPKVIAAVHAIFPEEAEKIRKAQQTPQRLLEIKESLLFAGLIREDASLEMAEKKWDSMKASEKQQLIELSPAYRRGRLKVSEFAVGFVPIAGTAYYWEEMSPTQRVLSITADVAFFAAPFILPRVFVALKGAARADKIAVGFSKGVKDTVQILKKTNPSLVKPFKAVTKAQAKFADDIVRVKELETVIMQTDDVVRTGRLAPGTVQYQTVQELLTRSNASLRLARTSLETSKTSLKSAWNAWQSASGAPGSASELIQHTQGIINKAITGTTKIAVAELEAKLLSAQRNLKAAQAKYPTSASKWSDLVADVARADANLKAAQIGSISELQFQLTAVREVTPILKKVVVQARATNSPYLADLEVQLARAEKLTEVLPKQIDDAVKTMELVWGRGGDLSRGGRVLVASPPGTGVSSVGTRSELARLLETGTSWEAARLLGIVPVTAISTTPVPISAPEAVPIPTPTVVPAPIKVPGIAPAITPAVIPAVTPAVAPAITPVVAPAITLAVTPAIAPALAVSLAPAPALVPAPVPVPAPVLTPTPVPPPIPMPIYGKPPLLIPTEEIPAGYGTIRVRSKFDGEDWEGIVKFVIESRKRKLSGESASANFTRVEPDTYSFKLISGKPVGAVDYEISPSKTRTLKAGTSTTFTIAFSSKPITEKVIEETRRLAVYTPTEPSEEEAVETPAGLREEEIVAEEEKFYAGVKKVIPFSPLTVEKHGTASTYIARTKEKLPLEKLSMGEFMTLRPKKMGSRFWRELGGLRGGVELLSEPSKPEIIQFGRKEVRTVVRRVAIGEGISPIPSRKMSKRVQRKIFGFDRYYLGHKLPETELGAEL